MFLNGDFWRQAMLLSFVSCLPILWFKYVSCRRRPDLQPTLHGALTIPLYKQMYYLVSVVGGIRALLYYIGAHKKPLTVKQMIAAGDERVLYLDPRWATNKAFLADEGEALRAMKEAENEAEKEVVAVTDFGTAKHDSLQSTILSEKEDMTFSLPASPMLEASGALGPNYSVETLLQSPGASQTSLESLEMPPKKAYMGAYDRRR